MAPQTSAKLTYEDYLLIPNDGRRHEIIDGEHYVNPSPNIRHQLTVRNIFRALDRFVEANKLGETFLAPCDVVLSEINIVEPDILFISAARLSIITAANVKGAPDLVVEVLSPGTATYDRTVKRSSYERFGVSEYWIVDSDEEVVTIHRRSGNRFQIVEVADPISSPLLPGFSLALQKLFPA